MAARHSITAETMLNEALYYRQMGISCFRLPSKSKKASVKWKTYAKELPTEKQLKYCFSQPGNIALIMGDVSGGLICRDFDVLASYERWAQSHPLWARKLPTVTTRRGRHVYAKTDIAKLQQSLHTPRTIFTFDDGELRCGGYCVAPPSIHPSGHVYRWESSQPTDFPLVNPFECGFLSGSLPCNTDNTGSLKRTQEDTGRLKRTHDIRKNDDISTPNSTREQQSEFSSEIKEQINQALNRTLPQTYGTRCRMIFEFARELRAISDLERIDPLSLEPFIRMWHKQALPHIRTKPFDETWLDFLNAWEKVKYPAGTGAIEAIFLRARQKRLPSIALKFEQTELRLLIALCRELQIEAGDKTFFLDCRTASSLLSNSNSISYATISRWLNLLRHERILKLVQRGTLASHKASEYYYLLGVNE